MSVRPNQLGLAGSAGVMTMARDKGNDHATREIRCGDRAGRSTGGPRGLGPAGAEDGGARSTVEAG